MTNQDKIDDYENKVSKNIRPYLVVEGNLEKIAVVGGFDKALLQADVQAAAKAGKPFIVHLNPADVLAYGGVDVQPC